MVLDLIRPVRITGIGAHAHAILRTYTETFGATIPHLQCYAIDPAESVGVGEALLPLAAAAVQPVIEAMFEEAGFAAQWVHWVVLVQVDDAEARARLRDTVLPCASDLVAAGYPLALSLVLLDPTTGVMSPAADELGDLAAALHAGGIAAATQCYFLRRRLVIGINLNQEEFAQYALLTCHTLVTANDRAVPPHVSAALEQSNAANANVDMGGDATQIRVFGRMAVQRIQSRATALAAQCAERRLFEFAREQCQPTRVEANWEAPIVTVQPPNQATDVRQQVGASIVNGPTGKISNEGLNVRDDASEQFARIEREAREWERSLRAWQRDVRILFNSLLNELRSLSAGERNRARDELAANARSLWADDAIALPLPHIAGMLGRQATAWAGEQEAGVAPADALRKTRPTDVQTRLDGLLKTLEREMRLRPHFGLLVGMSALVLGASVAFLWIIFSQIAAIGRVLPVINPAWQSYARIAQGVAIVATLGAVGYICGRALADTKTRWDAAHEAIRRYTVSVNNDERAALNREVELIDRHWHVKTIAACQRRLVQLQAHCKAFTRHLNTIKEPIAALQATSDFTHYIPQANAVEMQRAFDEMLVRFTTTQTASALRSGAMAELWLNGTSARWERAARRDLSDAFVTRYDGSGVDVGQALAVRLNAWPAFANSFMANAAFDQSGAAPMQQFVFGSGPLGTMAKQEGIAPHLGAVIADVGDGDELILCQAQTGLAATTAAR